MSAVLRALFFPAVDGAVWTSPSKKKEEKGPVLLLPFLPWWRWAMAAAGSSRQYRRADRLETGSRPLTKTGASVGKMLSLWTRAIAGVGSVRLFFEICTCTFFNIV